MTVIRRTKAYKEAVKKMTAQVDALSNGSWQGSGVAPQNIIDRIPLEKPKPKRGR